MALVEIHWARRLQALMPQISGPNLQENHVIETCKEEGCAVSKEETAARRVKIVRIEQLTHVLPFWIES
jgi:hypothetical protein